MRDQDDPRPPHGAVREVYDVNGAVALAYAPDLDGLADPGEIVWAWVPYEDDPRRGKDRPLLLVGRHGPRLLGVMLSSRDPDDHHRDEWLEIGPGPWDRQNRPSYARVDRIFELDEDGIRREGAILPPSTFAHVAAALQQRYGWRIRRER
ncbi:type II toxin-antitoxin system PemK/MazF family toxin [Sphaerisporangium sp. B11E5]|uniref:type II toxin-antitoxin system PemK/MazF family toxin n=1 Tax=Sphaerisporangium sp. B11E5 TaxID=3153563 RepID=UPI00325E7915